MGCINSEGMQRIDRMIEKLRSNGVVLRPAKIALGKLTLIKEDIPPTAGDFSPA